MIEKQNEEIDLSGVWQIAFDPGNEGVHQSWTGENWPFDRSQPIKVPEIWNINFPDAEGVGFYRTTFTVPKAWLDQVILIHFSGVIYRCEVWMNGCFAGSHEGGYTPFELDITKLVTPGDGNSLVVRVTALSRSKDIDGMKLIHSPLAKQSWHYVYGGIWGRVFIESRGKVICQSLSIDPNLKKENIQLKLCVQNRREECRQVDLHLEISDPNGKVVLVETIQTPVPPGQALYTFSIPISKPLAWSCEQPNLYVLKAQLIDEDGQADINTTHFGMRDFTVRDGQFFLNGEPLYIRGVILQPNFPIKMIEHTSRDMMVREMRLAKEAGFNLIRTHLQPPLPEYLDLADQMGMLIYAETSLAWIRDNPRLLDHGMREIRDMIALDRNHPSVVFWGIYNENPPASAINGPVLAQYARTLDPTRLIVEDSGGSLAIDQDFGWIDRAEIIPAWEVQPQRNFDVHLYLGSPIPAVVQNWLTNMGTGISSKVLVDERLGLLPVLDEFDRECRSYRGQFYVSELGCGGMADLDEQVAGFKGNEELLDARELKNLRDSLYEGFHKRHLEQIFGTLKRLYQEAQEIQCIGNTQQVEALLMNPRVAGYAITQLNDVSWEFHAGLLDVWRNPKPAYYASKRFNQPNIIILKTDHQTIAVGERMMIEIVLVNRMPLMPDAQAIITVADPIGNEIEKTQVPLPTGTGIYTINEVSLDIHEPGNHTITARLLVDNMIVNETIETILVLENVLWNILQTKVRCLGKDSIAAKILCSVQEGIPSKNSLEEDEKTVLLVAEPSTLSTDEWSMLLEAVKSGRKAVVGALRPENNDAINAFSRHGINLKLHFGIGSWMGCYHWAPQSDLFLNLPAGGVLKKPYTDILPKYVLSELGGEVLAGSLRNTIFPKEAPEMLWYSDIEVIRLGKGKILFCQYRIFEQGAIDPLADRMIFNLLTYAMKISVH